MEFTLTYSFSGLLDQAVVRGGGDLFFNGLQVANLQPGFCVTPPSSITCPQLHQVAQTIDEPITYGQPFSYQADDFMSGSGKGLGVFNQVTITASLLTGGTLVEVPEPQTLGFVGLVLFLGLPLIRRFRRPRNASGL